MRCLPACHPLRSAPFTQSSAQGMRETQLLLSCPKVVSGSMMIENNLCMLVPDFLMVEDLASKLSCSRSCVAILSFMLFSAWRDDDT